MRKGGVIAIIIIAVLVIAAIVGIIVVNNSNTSSGSTGGQISTSGGNSGQGLTFEENQDAEVTIIKSVTMPGWNSFTIDANTKDVTVDFYNPEENEGEFYLTFELKLADGTSLYKSGLVKAGDHVRNITLSRELEPGTYDAVVHIQPYTADEDLTAKNNASVKIKLIVE